MIIRQLTLENFGVYSGAQVFNLTPQPQNGYTRPIILLRGKNGAGKTTLIEAIRLCLHGSLALGSRVSRASYEAYLAQRIHTPPDAQHAPKTAKIVLDLDYVSAGQKKTYSIERAWDVAQGRLKETLRVWEDGAPLSGLHTVEEIDSFLRELILPGVADLFFFDGEKLHTLAQSHTISDTLAETIKALLGLHLVEQLHSDLDFYLARQKSEHNAETLHHALAEALQTMNDLAAHRADILTRQQHTIAAIAQKQSEIAQQKQRIAGQGSWFIERLETLQAARQRLEIDREVLQRRGQEFANGLLPFAIAPHLTSAVAERLRREALYETATAAQTMLNQQLTELAVALDAPELWLRVGLFFDEAVKTRMVDEVGAVLKQTVPDPKITETDVVHRVSAEDRTTLLHWIEQSQADVPRAFCETIRQLQETEAQLASINAESDLVPDDALLSPLVETLQRLNQELGALQKTADDLGESLRRLDRDIENSARQTERIRQEITAQARHEERIQLAGQTQTVLQAYARALRQEKTAWLARQLVYRFNILCRKEDLVDAARIDAETFEIVLYRRGQPFAFGQLSAGERQLLAMALMWALREVSGVPLPVIVDTPLGRLDSDHRLSVVHNYLPRVSHQVILLATDTEVDERLLTELVPATSHAYHLDYNAVQGRTVVHDGLPAMFVAQEKVEAL